MSDILCETTKEPILGYENAQIIVYSPACGEKHFVDIEWLFEEIIKGKGKGLMVMRDCFDRHHCIFG